MPDMIHYNQLIEFLKDASLHEIYRLSQAIDNEQNDPQRIAKARKQFKQDDIIEYFDATTNTYIAARVRKKKIKNVSVQNIHDGAYWSIPYYMIKLNSRNMLFETSGRSLTRNTLKVGDSVGFNHDGEAIVGQIKRLNHKTVSLATKNHGEWRVHYRSLHPIIDGKTDNVRVIESEIE